MIDVLNNKIKEYFNEKGRDPTTIIIGIPDGQELLDSMVATKKVKYRNNVRYYKQIRIIFSNDESKGIKLI